MFINGISRTLTTYGVVGANSLTLAADLAIGARGNATAFSEGYISDTRISKGVARWVTNFTPPYSPYGRVSTITSKYKFAPSGAEFKGYENLS